MNSFTVTGTSINNGILVNILMQYGLNNSDKYTSVNNPSASMKSK